MTPARWAAAVIAIAAGVAAADPAPAPGWEVRIPDKLDVPAGSAGTLPIAISVDRGLVISRDAQLIVDLDPSAGSGSGGLLIKRRRLGRADAVDPEADEPRFAVPVRADAEAAGDHAVAVRVRFWLCGSRVCRPIDVQRKVAVSVALPTPQP